MELKNSMSPKQPWVKLLLLGGLFVAGLFSLSPAPARLVPEVASRPLLIEEQEIVLSALDSLRTKEDRARELETRLQNADTTVLWSSHSQRLISRDKDRIVFSKRFFEADSLAQEQALKELVMPVSELARSHSTRPTGER